MQKIATWEKTLRVTVSAAVLCCTAPHSSAYAWDRLHPKEISTAKTYDISDILSKQAKAKTVQLPPSQTARVENKPLENVVLQAPSPIAAPVTPVIVTPALPVQVSSTDRVVLRPPNSPVTFLPVAQSPQAPSAPVASIVAAIEPAPAIVPMQVAQADQVVLRAPTSAPLPWITEQKLASFETITSVQPIMVAAVEEVQPVKKLPVALKQASPVRKTAKHPAPVVVAAVAVPVPEVQPVEPVEQAQEEPAIRVLKQASVKDYNVTGDHTAWRDEKEKPSSLTQADQSIVLTPDDAVADVAQEPVTKTLLDKIENAAQTSIEPALTGTYAFTEPEMLARIAPSAGEAPTILMPPKTAAPIVLEQPVVQPVTPLPKLVIPDMNPPQDNFSLPVVAEPIVQPVVKEERGPRLSEASRDILERIPPEPRYSSRARRHVEIERERNAPQTKEESIKKMEAYGMKIAVKRPKMDTFRALESAYNSLIAGDQAYAITQYKEVLEQDPENTLALFGLATTYHRAGQIKMARPLYSLLLTIDPHNVEGLNNFLVLLSDESPQDALIELAKLQRTHPNFSPVPAQMSLIYEKMGDYSLAASHMAKALAITPENLKYQYNMAIIYDKMGDWEESAKWYQRLISANDRGEKIPGNAQEIQQRLTFIRSNTGSRHS